MSLINPPLSKTKFDPYKRALICPKHFWMSQQNLVNIFLIKKNPKVRSRDYLRSGDYFKMSGSFVHKSN